MDPCGLEVILFQGSSIKKMGAVEEDGPLSLQQAETRPVTPRNIFTTNTNLDKVGLGPAPSPTEELKIDWLPCVICRLRVIRAT
jgi:hypothetical protein